MVHTDRDVRIRRSQRVNRFSMSATVLESAGRGEGERQRKRDREAKERERGRDREAKREWRKEMG